MISVSALAVNVDIHGIVSHVTADLVMCLIAMLVYWVLHRARFQTRHAKPSYKKIVDAHAQECPLNSELADDVFDIHFLPSQPTESSQSHFPSQLPPPYAENKSVDSAGLLLGIQRHPDGVCDRPEAAPFDVEKHVALMHDSASDCNIKDTLRIFRSIRQSGAMLTSPMYNAVLQAWINCGNIWAAESWMEDEIKEAGMADENSFLILIKALMRIRDLEKVRALLRSIVTEGQAPSIAFFDELFLCFAQGGFFDEGLSLLRYIDDGGIRPSSLTLLAIAELVNSARNVAERSGDIQKLLASFDFQSGIHLSGCTYPSEVPCLLSVALAAGSSMSFPFAHDITIIGSMVEVKRVQETMTEPWFEGLEVQHDKQQNEASRAQVIAVLKCVGKQSLCMPVSLEEAIMLYIGSDLYKLHAHFEGGFVDAELLKSISLTHPRIGVRHCWAVRSSGCCGQRTLVNGEETDEPCFKRHINAVHIVH